MNVESVENNNIEAPVKHQPVSTHHEQPQLPPEDEAVYVITDVFLLL